jgi:predicted membrane chloride channel (bestrophin family)
MAADLDFQTATMAKVFADQGHYEKAADIYRNLLKREPQRQDLADALSEVEERISEAGKSSDENLVFLLGEWVELVFRYKQLRFLRSVKKRI